MCPNKIPVYEDDSVSFIENYVLSGEYRFESNENIEGKPYPVVIRVFCEKGNQ